MGNTWGVRCRCRSVVQDVVAFVELGEEDGVEEDGPDAIVRLFQPDVVMGEGVRDIEQFGAEAKRATRRDLLDEEMAGVPRGGNRDGNGRGDGLVVAAGVWPSR